MRNTDRHDDLPVVETPEDVAVLYSWANLHGAKYRDFSASRREYRAQLRRRAAEQVRESELQAKDEAELAADQAAAHAEALGREAERAAELQREHEDAAAEYARIDALRHAGEAARVATAERMEAARRSEAAALAEAAARREEREIAEANASAQRQSARYAESERHRRRLEAAMPPSPIPGQISDPYTPLPQQAALLNPPSSGPAPLPEIYLEPVRMVPEPYRPARHDAQPAATRHDHREDPAPMSDWKQPPQFSDGDPPPPPASFRPRGYRPDDASGVRRIVRSPEFEDPSDRSGQLSSGRLVPPAPASYPERSRSTASPSETTRPSRLQPLYRPEAEPARRPSMPSVVARSDERSPIAARSGGSDPEYRPDYLGERNRPAPTIARSGVISPFSQQPLPSARTVQEPQRLREPEAYEAPAPVPERREHRLAEPSYRGEEPRSRPATVASTPQHPQAPTPAWIYGSADAVRDRSAVEPAEPLQPANGDTLQQSRERVASRWYALKGVFDQPGTTPAEVQPTRQKETRTPVLAVFSLAGGVGKTSLVATLGRSLSSLGEKVLLTDTTTHGLLPFYFGASELRQGTVRTFSPPSGSTDAPIYLVSYDADRRRDDEAAEEALAEEITTSGRGTHRVLLDLTAASAWVVRRLARTNPVILVPLAPDMNSVISLQMVERLFADVSNAEGRPLQIYYLLNHFDASVPLHLDVREVLRRQLGDRLLPFVIRRAPVVSEALAEGMTVVDYAPEAPVAEDYLHVANWLRTQAAPATAGFRNVRWSER